MRILFIKPKYIGDTLLLTPTLVAVQRTYPTAEIWVLVRRGCEGVLAGCPFIYRTLAITPVKDCVRPRFSWIADLAVLHELRTVVFDYVFELGDGHRARWFVLGTRWKKCFSVAPAGPLGGFWQRQFSGISTYNWQDSHRVEKDFFSVSEFLPLPLPIPPLHFEKPIVESWTPAAVLKSFAVLHLGTRQPTKQWYLEGWLKVGKFLLQRLAHVVITCGPDLNEITEARWLQAKLGDQALCTVGNVSWNQLAGLLCQAQLFVGLDTAVMHLAAACQCPIVALFGPSDEINWHPWQANHEIVTKRNCKLTKTTPNHAVQASRRSMYDLQVEDVIAACKPFLSEKPLEPRTTLAMADAT
ncbi:MAG: putative lipopolysaccharide heptosyltransferase [Pedosphaera sp.]|nr:putative lipopolysaccharide heptosyltransferase [Pedosphaera sp.]